MPPLLKRLGFGSLEEARKKNAEWNIKICVADDIALHERISGDLFFPFPDKQPPDVETLTTLLKCIYYNIPTNRVFLYCRQGKSRSPSFAVAYRMLMGASFSEATKLVLQVQPNSSFLPQLENKTKEALQNWK